MLAGLQEYSRTYNLQPLVKDTTVALENRVRATVSWPNSCPIRPSNQHLVSYSLLFRSIVQAYKSCSQAAEALRSFGNCGLRFGPFHMHVGR